MMLIGPKINTIIEYLYTIQILIVSVCIFSYIFNVVSVVISDLKYQEKVFHVDFEVLCRYMKMNLIPRSISARFYSHLRYHHLGKDSQKKAEKDY